MSFLVLVAHLLISGFSSVVNVSVPSFRSLIAIVICFSFYLIFRPILFGLFHATLLFFKQSLRREQQADKIL